MLMKLQLNMTKIQESVIPNVRGQGKRCRVTSQRIRYLIITTSAAGDLLPPVPIIDVKNAPQGPDGKILKQMKQDGVCNWLHNESGYMRKDLWQEFIEDFIK